MTQPKTLKGGGAGGGAWEGGREGGRGEDFSLAVPHFFFFFAQNGPVFRDFLLGSSSPPRAKHVCQAAQQKINEEVSLPPFLPPPLLPPPLPPVVDRTGTLVHQVDGIAHVHCNRRSASNWVKLPSAASLWWPVAPAVRL